MFPSYHLTVIVFIEALNKQKFLIFHKQTILGWYIKVYTVKHVVMLCQGQAINLICYICLLHNMFKTNIEWKSPHYKFQFIISMFAISMFYCKKTSVFLYFLCFSYFLFILLIYFPIWFHVLFMPNTVYYVQVLCSSYINLDFFFFV